jgi:hypothetical protein
MVPGTVLQNVVWYSSDVDSPTTDGAVPSVDGVGYTFDSGCEGLYTVKFFHWFHPFHASEYVLITLS